MGRTLSIARTPTPPLLLSLRSCGKLPAPSSGEAEPPRPHPRSVSRGFLLLGTELELREAPAYSRVSALPGTVSAPGAALQGPDRGS